MLNSNMEKLKKHNLKKKFPLKQTNKKKFEQFAILIVNPPLNTVGKL